MPEPARHGRCNMTTQGALREYRNGRPAVVTQGQRLDYWMGAICEGFLEMDVTSSRASHFEASLQRGQLQSIGVNRVLGTSQTFIERSRRSREANRTIITCLCKTDSEWSIVHHDHVSAHSTRRLNAGGFAAASTNSIFRCRRTPCRWNFRRHGSRPGSANPTSTSESALTGTPAGDGRSAAFHVNCHRDHDRAPAAAANSPSTSWEPCLALSLGTGEIPVRFRNDITTRCANVSTTSSGSATVSQV